MSAKQPAEPVKTETHTLPEWEHEATGKDDASRGRKSLNAVSSGWFAKLDNALPPHRSYLGLSRNVFLWTLLAIVLALLALIIGLAAGLSAGSV